MFSGFFDGELPMSQTFIGYCRTSTSEQNSNNQIITIEKRFTITKWFVDDGISGTIASAQRPAMNSLISYAREHDVIVVSAIDRLGRSVLDVLSTVNLFQDKGISIISIREGFDLSTHTGKLMLTMLAGVAELERNLIKERQKIGLERCKSEGKHLGRPKTIYEKIVAEWRKTNRKSIKDTATHFGISTASVSRCCAMYKAA